MRQEAAIVQVEERLTNCGLKPALLNLHDEDLNKREFLDQANARFPVDALGAGHGAPAQYPFDRLREARRTLNERVCFGRGIVHPSMPIERRHALAGMVQLRKELKNVPNVQIPSWQSLSRERLNKLLESIAEWPGLASIIADGQNIWNLIRPDAFAENANAANECRELCGKLIEAIQALGEPQEWVATVGVEASLDSDNAVAQVLALVDTVLRRPRCHPHLVGNAEITVAELDRLRNESDRRENLLRARHPVPLTKLFAPSVEAEARAILASEKAISWKDLHMARVRHSEQCEMLDASLQRYRRLCDQIGLVYSPFQKVRRAQLQAVLNLGAFGGLIPRRWWDAETSPVLEVNGWLGKLRACAGHAEKAPLPLNFIALERVSATHFVHVEAMAEHGFNLVSYCLKYVDDRRCKYALRQAYPAIPVKGFKSWREVTLHAVTAHQTMRVLREASASHGILQQLTENFLSEEWASDRGVARFTEHDDVRRLQKAAILVEQWRARNDLFEVHGVHWQTFWESANPSLLGQVESLLAELDELPLPNSQTDDLEKALQHFQNAGVRIGAFLDTCETVEGDQELSVLESLAAQREFAQCEERLQPIDKYLALQEDPAAPPDWHLLQEAIEWRDQFERLRGRQKLDVDSSIWPKLKARLEHHQVFVRDALGRLDQFIEVPAEQVCDNVSLDAAAHAILAGLPNHPLWLQKKRWQAKIPAYPEIAGLWAKVVEGGVKPEHAERLFCFNLLRLCDPIAKPHGPEFTETLKRFVALDENWLLGCSITSRAD